MRHDPVPAGQSLLELVIALGLLGLLATTAVGLLAADLRLVRQATDLTEAGNATRFTARLLRAEAATLAPADSHGFDTDSSRQRVFRGMGIVCDRTSTSVTVRYVGMRDPDPAKDSALVLTRAGELTQAVPGAASTSNPACAVRPGEVLRELDLTVGLRTGDLILLFETGTWHLSNAALRYARGAGGRQPLTAAVLLDDSTGITADTSTAGPVALRLALVARPASGMPTHLIRERYRIALLNLATPLDSVVLE